MGIHAPHGHTPAVPLPVSPTPFFGAMTGRPTLPIDPWRTSLRLAMLLWGSMLLAVFATPLRTDPMTFQWDVIGNLPDTAKVEPMMLAAVGLLSIVLAAIPMVTLARALLAAVLGLAGFIVPTVLHGGLPEWRDLVLVIGALLLVPGLLVRNEYTDSLLARVLVTIGVACVLAPAFVPVNGEIPMMVMFKMLIHGSGKTAIRTSIDLAFIITVLMSLLAWMPGPASAGAKIFAWVLLSFLFVEMVAVPLLLDHVTLEAIKGEPYHVMAWAPPTAYMVLAGYGSAAVIGSQLE
jgi:hypothetical protein